MASGYCQRSGKLLTLIPNCHLRLAPQRAALSRSARPHRALRGLCLLQLAAASGSAPPSQLAAPGPGELAARQRWVLGVHHPRERRRPRAGRRGDLPQPLTGPQRRIGRLLPTAPPPRWGRPPRRAAPRAGGGPRPAAMPGASPTAACAAAAAAARRGLLARGGRRLPLDSAPHPPQPADSRGQVAALPRPAGC